MSGKARTTEVAEVLAPAGVPAPALNSAPAPSVHCGPAPPERMAARPPLPAPVARLVTPKPTATAVPDP